MDCYKSFNFQVDTNGNQTGTSVKQWTVGVDQTFWSVTTGTSSTYNIQGFKNINVHGIDVIGSISTLTGAGIGGVIVNDWNIDVSLTGQIPIIGSTITAAPNFYSISNTSVQNSTFPIGKYSNSIKFASPYQSVTSIILGNTYATGTGFQTAGSVNLYWNLNFIVYYSFEGE
jgi:hypothetical protein